MTFQRNWYDSFGYLMTIIEFYQFYFNDMATKCEIGKKKFLTMKLQLSANLNQRNNVLCYYCIMDRYIDPCDIF